MNAFKHSTKKTVHSYASNATRISRLMRDEIMPAKDMAAYWIEHVLRHGGTKHLQSRAQDMPFYQLYLLDIWFVLIGIPAMVLFVTIKLCAWSRCRSNVKSRKIKSQ